MVYEDRLITKVIAIDLHHEKKNSFWSAINIKKIEDLSAKGLMTPLGLKAFSYRNESNSYNSTDKTENLLKNEYLEQFKNNSIAWELFEQQAPSYKRLTIHWIMSAKKEETQLRRLYKTIEESEQGKRVKLFG